jgi:vacuolar-type H+-ATPase subunit E/Vma4
MSDDDYGLGLKVHEDAYRELEEELAKAKSKLEEVGFRACCVLLERDEAREQRDRLAEALRELCGALLKDRPRNITALLNKAGEALASVKGGQP